jgi:ABC-2 type transport system ATP-binding protein
MADSATPSIQVRGLRKAYGELEAVRGVDFTVGRGEIFGLLGPNGAGKTTIVECLVGLREPDAGDLFVCGLDVRLQPREVKRRIGVALQSTSLQDKITPREALRLFGALYGGCVPADELLARFDLGSKADAALDTLSGGQRQRLALALAFVNRPELVVLDEPTTGLDPQARRELLAAIGRMKADGCTVLLTTHHLDEAEELCDRVAIVDRGRITAAGRPRDLVAAAGAPHTVALRVVAPLDAKVLARLPGVSGLRGEGTDWNFAAADATAAVAALGATLAAGGNALVDLRVRRATLEDVYLGLTRGEEEAA